MLQTTRIIWVILVWLKTWLSHVGFTPLYLYDLGICFRWSVFFLFLRLYHLLFVCRGFSAFDKSHQQIHRSRQGWHEERHRWWNPSCDCLKLYPVQRRREDSWSWWILMDPDGSRFWLYHDNLVLYVSVHNQSFHCQLYTYKITCHRSVLNLYTVHHVDMRK